MSANNPAEMDNYNLESLYKDMFFFIYKLYVANSIKTVISWMFIPAKINYVGSIEAHCYVVNSVRRLLSNGLSFT